MPINDFNNELAEIVAEILDTSQREDVDGPKAKHKLDERHRRLSHNKLLKLAEKICSQQLDRLQNPNLDSDMEDLDSQVLRAMMTGNHKKGHTKAAIYIAQLLKHREEAEVLHRQTIDIHVLRCTIQTLKCTIQSAGVPFPDLGRVGCLASPTSQQRKSYF